MDGLSLLPRGAAVTAVSPGDPDQLERTLRVLDLGCPAASPTHQPHIPPPTGSLSSGLCDPSDIRAIQPLPPFVCTSPGPAPFFKGLAPATSQPQPSPWRTAKSMQMPSQALSPAHLHQSPWSLPRTLPGSSPHNYTLDTAIAWRCSASRWELF